VRGGMNTVWGGEWNQPLLLGLSRFCRKAQGHLLRMIDLHDLQVPTRVLPARTADQFSIDPINVSAEWVLIDADKVPVADRLSHRDSYWVEVSVPQDQGQFFGLKHRLLRKYPEQS
jgi:hypothetical protein